MLASERRAGPDLVPCAITRPPEYSAVRAGLTINLHPMTRAANLHNFTISGAGGARWGPWSSQYWTWAAGLDGESENADGGKPRVDKSRCVNYERELWCAIESCRGFVMHTHTHTYRFVLATNHVTMDIIRGGHYSYGEWQCYGTDEFLVLFSLAV